MIQKCIGKHAWMQGHSLDLLRGSVSNNNTFRHYNVNIWHTTHTLSSSEHFDCYMFISLVNKPYSWLKTIMWIDSPFNKQSVKRNPVAVAQSTQKLWGVKFLLKFSKSSRSQSTPPLAQRVLTAWKMSLKWS